MEVTLDILRAKQEVMAPCINQSTEPHELKASMVIEISQPVDEDQVEETGIRTQSLLPRAYPSPVANCPAHIHSLLKQARLIYDTKDWYGCLGALLTARKKPS